MTFKDHVLKTSLSACWAIWRWHKLEKWGLIRKTKSLKEYMSTLSRTFYHLFCGNRDVSYFPLPPKSIIYHTSSGLKTIVQNYLGKKIKYYEPNQPFLPLVCLSCLLCRSNRKVIIVLCLAEFLYTNTMFISKFCMHIKLLKLL